MKKLLIGSVAMIVTAILALAGSALLGPDDALAQDSDNPDTVTTFRFAPLDEVLDELVAEDVINSEQADAIRRRMSDKMPSIEDGFRFPGFQMEGFLDDLPEGVTAPPGPPGTEEFDQWLEDNKELLGDDFFGGHMFRFEGELPGDGFFPFGGGGPMGPGMMGDGFGRFHEFGDLNPDDIQGMIDEMTERFGDEIPDQVQDMLDHLQDQLSDTDGAETSLDA